MLMIDTWSRLLPLGFLRDKVFRRRDSRKAVRPSPTRTNSTPRPAATAKVSDEFFHPGVEDPAAAKAKTRLKRSATFPQHKHAVVTSSHALTGQTSHSPSPVASPSISPVGSFHGAAVHHLDPQTAGHRPDVCMLESDITIDVSLRLINTNESSAYSSWEFPSDSAKKVRFL